MNPANAWLLLTTRSTGVGFTPGGWGSIRPSDVARSLAGLDRPRFLLGMAVLAGDRDGMEDLVAHLQQQVVEPAAEFGEWRVKDPEDGGIHFAPYRRLATLLLFEAINQDDQKRGIRCFVCSGKGFYYPVTSQQDTVREMEQERERVRRASSQLKQMQWGAARLAREIKQAGGVKKADKIKVRKLNRQLRRIGLLSQMASVSQVASPCQLCRRTGVITIRENHRAWLTGFSYDHWLTVWAKRYAPLHLEVNGWVSDCLTHVREAFTGHAA